MNEYRLYVAQEIQILGLAHHEWAPTLSKSHGPPGVSFPVDMSRGDEEVFPALKSHDSWGCIDP